jgi:hypothetical protein
MLIKNKVRTIVVRLTDENYKKLIKKAIEKSQKDQKISSITDIVTGLIEKIK